MRAFWDKNIDYFDPGSSRKSFYYHGTSGAVAWLLTRYLQQPKKKIKDLLDFLPPKVAERLRFYPERTAPLHSQDRVGTYGSLHLAEVL